MVVLHYVTERIADTNVTYSGDIVILTVKHIRVSTSVKSNSIILILNHMYKNNKTV